jgi:hypothetical protein
MLEFLALVEHQHQLRVGCRQWPGQQDCHQNRLYDVRLLSPEWLRKQWSSGSMRQECWKKCFLLSVCNQDRPAKCCSGLEELHRQQVPQISDAFGQVPDD